MKITIELEKADMTDVSSAALVAFLSSIPSKKAPASRKPRAAKTETAPATEPAAAEIAPAPEATPEAGEAPEPFDAAREALRVHAQANGREAAIGVLNQFAPSVSALTEAQIPDLLRALGVVGT